MKMVFRGIVCYFKLFALVKVHYYFLLFILALLYLEYLEYNKQFIAHRKEDKTKAYIYNAPLKKHQIIIFAYAIAQ